jgi:hypothetical protein
VEGRYCSNCGQENLVPQESAWHLVTHFFNDITHFDGKFFTSLKDLLFKPGFLTKEYVAGRRASYLNPVRMYIFTSFIFFFIFFGFVSEPIKMTNSEDKEPVAVQANRTDSTRGNVIQRNHKNNITKGEGISLSSGDYRDRKEYDSLKKLGLVKENFIQRWMTQKELGRQERYGNDSKKINEVILENFRHSAPQMLFISLPLLALVLKLLYIRRKSFYYVSHAIFVVHLICFVFLITLVNFGLDALSQLPYLSWLSYLQIAFSILIFFYAYKAMRNFYGQRRAKTIFKYILLLISLLIIMGFAMAIMLVYSVYKT